MTADRLDQVIDAYGADPRRWPDGERSLAAGPEAAVRLTEAAALDALLDRAPRPAVSTALRDRVLASALEAGLKPRRPWPRLGFAWLSGAGWAAATCAGVLAGMVLTAQTTADLRADAVLYQASLASVDDTEVLG